ncbi:EAL domain-containing protein [Mesorhizobium sp. CA13]|uniref:putative bifunctional diguanylate cyclase/phosphodiesterase n=2 Tax=Mesorhizobium TaxID=68287 RepID=UPI001CCFA383|nr:MULTISPECIES: EAL domain-containing protein [unclassified Mesorhizobium]MBZ9857484.1 EAL domain-containing protein [Mesorhizobium sp. CA13]MBZ9966689.1 EAL domain-containing protein [Mesorhizobium sp. BR1-1-2]MCA0014853.1 EAL domain-containing protein [Mesorhizobium sp. B294B1A1]MCA0041027.1 EAL domain-containing protein [Mesorhizobium sp. B292B1B]
MTYGKPMKLLRHFGEPTRRLFLLRTALPIIGLSLFVAMATTGLLLWSTVQTDGVAVSRQQSLVALIISKLESGVAHDQESVTVWDDAVTALRSHDTKWLDVNLGSWMHTYFGHDELYILDPDNEPVYASLGGSTVEPGSYRSIHSNTARLVDDLRARLKRGDTEGVTKQVLTIGASDMAVISGHPAIVSIKPVVSDTGHIAQEPGQEFLHIAVRYLDGSLITSLRQDYLLDGARFSWVNMLARGEASYPLIDRSGSTIGFFVWQPYRPGASVFSQLGPMLVATFGLLLGGVIVVLMSLRRRTLKLIESEDRIYHLAHNDLLTALPNRSQFNDRLADALTRLPSTGDQLAILYLDLDRFKQVNDSFGHPAGDELLREFSDRLRRLTTEADTVARLGGDEFIIIHRQVAGEHEVKTLCERLIETARRPFEVAGVQVFVGVSVGAALAPRDGCDRDELVRKADVALYHAKAAGRSGYVFFKAEMDQTLAMRKDLEQELRKALQVPGQIQVHYQPLYTADTNRMAGVEALARWSHAERGWVAPDLFVPLAEKTGLIDQLGELVLRQACLDAVSLPIDTLAVNVSALQLNNPSFALKVTSILLEAQMDPRRLELEVTESTLSERPTECQRNIEALRSIGVRFALDDFGTGFSSLGRLQTLDVDRIKIDRSFVQGFGRSNGDEAIVQAIIDMARVSGLNTTAEGVETQSQCDFLRKLGCDQLQGYLLSKPVPKEELQNLLEGRSRRVSA